MTGIILLVVFKMNMKHPVKAQKFEKALISKLFRFLSTGLLKFYLTNLEGILN